MTQLYFRHSPVYEQMISKLDGTPYSDADIQAGMKHAADFAAYWGQYNDRVFAAFEKLGFQFADFWIAYFVRPRNSVIPHSDPLTIFIDSDYEKTLAVLLHELTHVMMVYPGNESITDTVLDTLSKKFPEMELAVRYEVAPALVSRAILADLFGAEKGHVLQERERNLPVLDKAWAVIDSSPAALGESNPLLAIGKLA